MECARLCWAARRSASSGLPLLPCWFLPRSSCRSRSSRSRGRFAARKSPEHLRIFSCCRNKSGYPRRGSFLVEETITQNCVQRHHAVTPRNFLSFFIGTARVRDRHFVDPPPSLGHSRRHFRLKAEAIRAQPHPPNHFLSENLVTGFHVGERQVRDNVGKQRQEFISNVMPEEVNALRAAQKPRSVHNIGAAVQDRFNQLGVLSRVIFKIGVLDQENIATGLGETAPQGSAFPLIAFLKQEMHIAQAQIRASVQNFRFRFAGLLQAVHLRQPFAGSIGRSVVNDHDFMRDPNSLHSAQNLLDKLPLVVRGNDDGNRHRNLAVRVCIPRCSRRVWPAFLFSPARRKHEHSASRGYHELLRVTYGSTSRFAIARRDEQTVELRCESSNESSLLRSESPVRRPPRRNPGSPRSRLSECIVQPGRGSSRIRNRICRVLRSETLHRAQLGDQRAASRASGLWRWPGRRSHHRPQYVYRYR